MLITLRSLLVPAVLCASIALPLHAYYPQFTRTHLSSQVTAIRSLASIDVNGDGRPDVAGHNAAATVFYAIAQANRMFAPPVGFYTGTNLTDIAAGDFDGDGDSDIVVSDIGANALVFLQSNSNATFAAPVVTSLSMAPDEIASGDYNGDTKLDLILLNTSGSVLAVFAGDGAGHFAEVSRMTAPVGARIMTPGDADGDGHMDFLVLRSEPKDYQLYFGNGDATFDAPISVPSSLSPSRIRIEDLDGDGDREIITANYVESSVDVIVNLGSRTFGAPVLYPVRGGTHFNDAVDLAVAEVTGDAFPDVVVVLMQSKMIGTLAGNGNGTLRAPAFASVLPVSSFSTIFPERLAVGDFTGDGRIDVAVSGSGRLSQYENVAGDGSVTLRAIYPTITAGQTARYEVTFKPGFLAPFSHPGPYATGVVTIKEGETILGSGTPQNNIATIEVPSLPLGTHSITASFAGDENYRAATSTVVTQNVIAESTTVALTAPSELQYGQQPVLHAEVTSPVAGGISGWVDFFRNGQHIGTVGAPDAYSYPDGLSLGTHQFQAKYEGNATHPPATSNTIEVTIVRATTTLEFYEPPPNRILRYGQQPEIRLTLDTAGSALFDGTVQLYEGTTLLASLPAVGDVRFTMPVLSTGVHYLYAKYTGSENFHPSQSALQRFTILPASGFVIDAYVNEIPEEGGGPRIRAWGLFTLPAGGHYKIYRKIGNGAWQIENGMASFPSGEVTSPLAGTAYAYKMEAYDSAGALLATSNVDVAMLYAFSDKPLVPGTRIRAQHIQELVQAINAMRSGTGLWPIAVPNATAGQPIRVSHLNELREALNQSRAALGAPIMTYSGGAALNSPVLSRHLQELRDAIQ